LEGTYFYFVEVFCLFYRLPILIKSSEVF